MIEINLTKLEKKKIWVKDPSKKGGGYWSHRKVGRKERELSEREKLIKVIDWMDSHMRSQTGVKPSEGIIKIIKDHKWTYNGKVYRGVHWGAYYKPYDSPQGEIKKGDKISEKKDFSSWTTSKNVATSFVITGAYDSWLISDINPYFPTIEQRVKKRYESEGWGAGIILETNISEGIDIEKIREEMDENPDVSSYADRTLPALYESEVLSLEPVEAKIIKHYHPDKKV